MRAVATYLDVDLSFRISSHAVSFASPVWKKAILFPRLPPGDTNESESGDGTLAERHDGGDQSIEKVRETVHDDQPCPGGEDISSQTRPDIQEKVLDLREDDFETVILLLRIAHLQFDKIPSSMSLEALVKIAELCDNYGCVKLVGPWLPDWLKNEDEESKEIGHEKWLFIAWVFGREKVFENLVMKMVCEVMTDDEGNCLNSEGKVIQLALPHGIIESILDIRQVMIGTLLDVPYSLVEKYESGKRLVCRYSEKACDSMIYGSLLLGLGEIDLWPQKNPTAVHISIENLRRKLNKVEILRHEEVHSRNFHSGCVCCLNDELSIISANFPDPVLASHRQHMKIQNGLLEIWTSKG